MRVTASAPTLSATATARPWSWGGFVTADEDARFWWFDRRPDVRRYSPAELRDILAKVVKLLNAMFAQIGAPVEILWLGPFEDLLSGPGEFPQHVRELFLCESSPGLLQAAYDCGAPVPPIPTESVREFVEFLEVYGQ